ncbi:SEC-C metal-binding domain-containing protein [Guggenheimella bovis]
MKIYDVWKGMSDSLTTNEQHAMFWKEYFDTEKGIYQEILKERPEEITGTVQELSDRFHVEPPIMAGFLDGINESIETPNDVENLEEDSVVALKIDYPKLFKNMLRAKAKWLSGLKEWDEILDKETKLRLKHEFMAESIVVNENKVGRNDPCPCGSGKKYKACCLKKEK